MMNREIAINDNIVDNHDRLLAWTRDDSFPIKHIDNVTKEKLNLLSNIFISFEGAHGKRDIVDYQNNLDVFDFIFEDFFLFIQSYIKKNKNPSYFLLTEHSLEVKSRVRSYKGILPKKIKEKSKYIELEVPVDEMYTMFVALIELNSENLEILIKSYLNNYTSCIITSNNIDTFSESFLKRVPLDFMNHSGTSTINFLKLIVELCPKKDIIYRMGGDGGDKEITFQVFCTKEKKDLIFLQMEAVINEL